MARPIVLVVDDDVGFRDGLSRALGSDIDVRSIGSLPELARSMSPPPDAALVDLCLDPQDPANRDGFRILQQLRSTYRWLPILMITGHGDIDIAVEAMREGATDFIQKRASLKEIRARLDNALRQSELGSRVSELERDISLLRPREIVGESFRMQEIRRLIEGVARDGRATVLVRGETGTGKELVARAIHAGGWRAKGPFVPVALNAFPHSMIETELLGFEPGAFTDARERHIGYLERAHRGVLFLDEIADVEPAIQVKLLRFLEEREFQRLGSTTTQRVDVQIVAATNANLEDRVREGKLREDLYFRLKVHEIVLPPLRERAEDIPLLVEYFLGLFRQEGKRIKEVAPEAVRVLQWFRWPGNVRQLRNVLESAMLWAEMHSHARVEADDLPAEIRTESGRRELGATPQPGDPDFNLEEALARTELQHTAEALRIAGWRKTEAWQLLGYKNRFTMRRRVTRLIEQHRRLENEFPDLAEAFGSKSSASTA